MTVWSDSLAEFHARLTLVAQGLNRRTAELKEWEHYLAALREQLESAVGGDGAAGAAVEATTGPATAESAQAAEEAAAGAAEDVAAVSAGAACADAAESMIAGAPPADVHEEQQPAGYEAQPVAEAAEEQLEDAHAASEAAAQEDEALLATLDEETAKAVKVMRRLSPNKRVAELVEQYRARKQQTPGASKQKSSWWRKGG